MEAIRRLFSPEFRNRLDAVPCSFAGLDQDTIERVVDKLLIEGRGRSWNRSAWSISIDEPARRWIAKKGYDPKMGARPMARRHSGVHQTAAGGGVIVRQAGQRRTPWKFTLSEEGDKFLKTRKRRGYQRTRALLSHES